MERRTFLLAIGGTAGGAAGLFSVGAFSRLEAERTVVIKVAGDADAYLRLAPTEEPNGHYAVERPDGTLALDFTDDNAPSGGGDGINSRAITTFREVFLAGNQGTQKIDLEVQPVLFPDQGVALAIVPEGEDPREPIELAVGEAQVFSVVAAAYDTIEPDSTTEMFELLAEVN